MACDACGKMRSDLQPLSENMRRYLPLKYTDCQICHSCADKLNDKLDTERQLAWQKAALLLVDMVRKPRPTTAQGKEER